jgi:hypothetical protein
VAQFSECQVSNLTEKLGLHFLANRSISLGLTATWFTICAPWTHSGRRLVFPFDKGRVVQLMAYAGIDQREPLVRRIVGTNTLVVYFVVGEVMVSTVTYLGSAVALASD